MADPIDCPFCDFISPDSYVVILHVEQHHTHDSPFVVRAGSHAERPQSLSPQKEQHSGSHARDPSPDDEQWVLCPQPDCGEQVHLAELDEHADFHMAERLTAEDKTAQSNGMHYPISTQHSLKDLDNFDTSLPEELRQSHSRARSDSSKTSLSRSILDILSSPGSSKSSQSGKLKNKFGSVRLGKSELGPYAFEERMPKWLHDKLEAGPKVTQQTIIGRDGKLVRHEVVENETPAILPILAQLLDVDKQVKRAYLCHPSTVHICKTPKAGGFCGYRNIQMLVSYMQGARAQGYDKFPGRTPGILRLQDLIEAAWDKGMNEISRAQTGGIKDTRKYIGTPEVMALLQSLGIDYDVQAFTDRKHEHAYQQLMDDVEKYFKSGAKDSDAKVHKTNLPPIYLQQPGHSISIVGFERYKDGSRDLLVFDPMFNTSPGMRRLLGRKDIRTSRPEVLQAYRRSSGQLKRHRDFEIVKLTAHASLFPAWDVLDTFSDCPYVYAFLDTTNLHFDIIPEDNFRPFFPWTEYGRLFSIQDARFTSSSASTEACSDLDGIERLAGLPFLSDDTYKNWLKCDRAECQEACCRPNPQQPLLHGFAVPHVKIAHSSEGSGSEPSGVAVSPPSTIWSPSSSCCASLSAYESSALYVSPHYPSSDPDAEDVYFERGSEFSVPVHYGCGSTYSEFGRQHHNDGKCFFAARPPTPLPPPPPPPSFPAHQHQHQNHHPSYHDPYRHLAAGGAFFNNPRLPADAPLRTYACPHPFSTPQPRTPSAPMTYAAAVANGLGAQNRGGQRADWVHKWRYSDCS